jgi:hypothetical protein
MFTTQKNLLTYIPILIVFTVCTNLLTGCGSTDEYKNEGDSSQSIPGYSPIHESPQKSSGDYAVFGHEGGSGSSGSALVGGGGGSPVAGSDSDYIAKSDIYWKFNYLKTVLDQGRTPQELGQAIVDIQNEAAKTQQDDKTPIIAGILSELQSGLDSDKLIKKLQAAGVDISRIPWGTGRISVHEALQRLEEKSGVNLDTDLRQKIQDYEELNHSSPDLVKKTSFQQACDQTVQLGGMLGLLNRKENSPPGAPTLAK